MAACGSLQHIFETPLPETPSSIFETTLLSPWNKLAPSIDGSDLTELFGELHFKETNNHHVESSSTFPLSSPFSSLSPSSSPSWLLADSSKKPGTEISRLGYDMNNESTDEGKCYYPASQKRQYRHSNSNSFSSINSENLSLCTEGLGFESSDDIEDLRDEKRSWDITRRYNSESRRSSRVVRTRKPFPPPISCIGRNGKPWVCFKSFREDGRFILKEIRIPTQEFLHACREDGRLKLQLIQSDDEYIDDDDDDDDLEGFGGEEEDEAKGEDGDGDSKEGKKG